MVKFNAGILSFPLANLSSSPFSVIKEYSKFNKLCRSVVSNAKAKCFAASGYADQLIRHLSSVIRFLFYPDFLFQKYK